MYCLVTLPIQVTDCHSSGNQTVVNSCTVMRSTPDLQVPSSIPSFVLYRHSALGCISYVWPAPWLLIFANTSLWKHCYWKIIYNSLGFSLLGVYLWPRLATLQVRDMWPPLATLQVRDLWPPCGHSSSASRKDESGAIFHECRLAFPKQATRRYIKSFCGHPPPLKQYHI